MRLVITATGKASATWAALMPGDEITLINRMVALKDAPVARGRDAGPAYAGRRGRSRSPSRAR